MERHASDRTKRQKARARDRERATETDMNRGKNKHREGINRVMTEETDKLTQAIRFNIKFDEIIDFI